MMGKILGTAAAGLTQFLVWGILMILIFIGSSYFFGVDLGAGPGQGASYAIDQVNDLHDRVIDARLTLRTFSESLATDLTIIQTREDFTEDLINTLAEGSDRLTLADQNKEAAEMLALQTRQAIETVALGLVASSNASILTLIANTQGHQVIAKVLQECR